MFANKHMSYLHYLQLMQTAQVIFSILIIIIYNVSDSFSRFFELLSIFYMLAWPMKRKFASHINTIDTIRPHIFDAFVPTGLRIYLCKIWRAYGVSTSDKYSNFLYRRVFSIALLQFPQAFVMSSNACVQILSFSNALAVSVGI